MFFEEFPLGEHDRVIADVPVFRRPENHDVPAFPRRLEIARDPPPAHAQRITRRHAARERPNTRKHMLQRARKNFFCESDKYFLHKNSSRGDFCKHDEARENDGFRRL